MAKTLIERTIEAVETLVDHAEEMYPHFESERGQRDIAEASAVLGELRGLAAMPEAEKIEQKPL
jgi:hypothetical protein